MIRLFICFVGVTMIINAPSHQNLHENSSADVRDDAELQNTAFILIFIQVSADGGGTGAEDDGEKETRWSIREREHGEELASG